MPSVTLAALATATHMGQQEYEHQLAQHLPSVAPELSVRSVHIRSLRSSLRGDARLPLSALSAAPRAVQMVAARLAYGRSDLVHRMDLRLPAARNEVVTVHDLAPLRFDDEGELAPSAAKTLRAARAVICPSAFAAAELADLFGVTDAVVIPNGLDPAVWEPLDAAGALRGLQVTDAFVLHSGGATKRKNLAALADAWARVAPLHPHAELLMCGPPDPRRHALFAELPRVRLLGRVARGVHIALMDRASVVVVPSLYEGFGFPALEAMARGTAVVAADAASLPEVCGDAALLSQPDGASLADAVNAMLGDPAMRERYASRGPARARQFSWAASARQHADVLRGAI